MLAVRSSEVAAEASGIAVNRTKIMIFALSAAIAGFGGVLLGLYSFSVHQHHRAAATRALLARARGHVRHPPPRRRAARRVRVRRRRRRVPLDRRLVVPRRRRRAGADHVDLLRPDPVGLGAIQLAQEPDGILSLAGQQRLAQEAREGAAGAHRRGRSRGPRRRRARARAVHARGADGDAAPRRRDAWTTASPTRCSRCDGIVAGYGDAEVLHGVDLRLDRGKVTALLGANGAGKSTLCSVAAGHRRRRRFGTVCLEGNDITHARRSSRARAGVLLVPEARGIFPGLTVEENLTVLLRDPTAAPAGLRAVPDPRPSGASRSPGLLSGGEQQMLSLAPALADPPEGADRRRAHPRPRAARRRRGDAGDRRAARRAAPRCCSSRSTRRTR